MGRGQQSRGQAKLGERAVVSQVSVPVAEGVGRLVVVEVPVVAGPVVAGPVVVQQFRPTMRWVVPTLETPNLRAAGSSFGLFAFCACLHRSQPKPSFETYYTLT